MKVIGSELHEYIGKNYRKRKVFDAFMRGLLVGAAALALVPLFSVLMYVVAQGFPSLNGAFFTHTPQSPDGVPGMANALVGTALLVLIGSLLGVTWGIVTGIYLSEYGRGKLGTVVRFCTDMLASVPSIVIGLFVYAIIVIPMRGFSGIAGGVALGLIMIPTVARSTEELLRLVPTHIREAGLALGLPRWKVILRIVLRGCASGILTGVMLAIARVAGETAPLLFTALGNDHWSLRLDQPMASLPRQIYNYAIAPTEELNRLAWTGSLVLVLFVFVVNIASRILIRQPAAGRE